ncbi:MAG: phosphatidylglycerophosphatase A [Myxococcota bacterium]
MISTFCYVGCIGRMPGTWGSLASLAIWAPLVLLNASPPIRLAFILFVFLIGWWATHHSRHQFKSLDPKEVVIDEVAGMGLTLAFCPADISSIVAAFLLFRFLDIVKPWPISWVDRKVKSALGVMMDDMVAGLIGAVILSLLV